MSRILLLIGGGIAAYKSLDLIRRLRERGASVTPVMTAAAQHFVTPLAVGALTASRVHTDLFDREAEVDVGHIRLAREHDLVLVAPATADLMGKLANGLANDLASTILLATRAAVLMAPAMNPAMWSHPATRRSRDRLEGDGVRFVGPGRGEMAERGEAGEGRMSEPLEIAEAAFALLREAGASAERHPSPGLLAGRQASPGLLAGRRAIVTSGPTHEAIDPVRYIANRSSGRQGHAIAEALAAAGARVTLVAGPVSIPDPAGVTTVHVESARQMLAAVEAALPADIAVMVAAVADWRPAETVAGKIKKRPGEGPPPLALVENPDILATLGHSARRPTLLVGFAAETSDIERYGALKLKAKGADWIVANDVSAGSGVTGGVMGGTRNRVALLGPEGVERWPEMDKGEVAARLVERMAARLGAAGTGDAPDRNCPNPASTAIGTAAT